MKNEKCYLNFEASEINSSWKLPSEIRTIFLRDFLKNKRNQKNRTNLLGQYFHKQQEKGKAKGEKEKQKRRKTFRHANTNWTHTGAPQL